MGGKPHICLLDTLHSYVSNFFVRRNFLLKSVIFELFHLQHSSIKDAGPSKEALDRAFEGAFQCESTA